LYRCIVVNPESTIADELYHHGVKGMKWGVVREKISATGRVIGSPLGKKNLPPSVTQREKYNERAKARAAAASGQNGGQKQSMTTKKPSTDNDQQTKPKESDHDRMKRLLRDENLNTMSNDDLSFLRNRLQLETEYKKITAPKPGMKEWMMDTLQNQAKKTVEWAVGEAMKGAVKKLIFDKSGVKVSSKSKKKDDDD